MVRICCRALSWSAPHPDDAIPTRWCRTSRACGSLQLSCLTQQQRKKWNQPHQCRNSKWGEAAQLPVLACTRYVVWQVWICHFCFKASSRHTCVCRFNWNSPLSAAARTPGYNGVSSFYLLCLNFAVGPTSDLCTIRPEDGCIEVEFC